MRTGNDAAAWAEARETFTPVNNCLRAVLVAYDVLGQIEALARADATATEAWDLAEGQHPDDWNPPRGALVCFPNWGAGKSGHIAIGQGGNRVRSTGIDSIDYFTGTIAEVAERCGNPYAGWAGDFAGTPINFTSTAGGGGRPINEQKEHDDMDLNYIYWAGDAKNPREYALLSPSSIDGGVRRTKDLAAATAYAITFWGQSQNASPYPCKSFAEFESVITLAKDLAASYKKINASTVTGGVTVDNSAVVAAITALGALITKNAPPTEQKIAAEVIRQQKLPGN